MDPINNGASHKPPGSLPPGLFTKDKGKGKQKETDEPSTAGDGLLAQTIGMELGWEDEDPEYQEYYGAGLVDVLASGGISTSPTLPVPYQDPIDHSSIGVYVDGVTANETVVEDSLWGDPLEDINKKLKKEKKAPLCDNHGRVCSKGICKIYEKQLREIREEEKKEEKKKKELKESQTWRGGNGGQRNGRGGERGRERGGRPLLRGSASGKGHEPSSPTDGGSCHNFSS